MESMDAATVRAMLERHFEYAESDPDAAHDMYHEDAVLEFPQSGERFAGIENLREWRTGIRPTRPSISRGQRARRRLDRRGLDQL